jgi:DnaK suppressor protein
MTLRKEKLESFRKQLVARRQVLAVELRQATADFINDEAMYSDSVDQAAADTDKSLALQFKNRDRNILWEIDEALKRIDEGTFGECESCGEPIAEARMKANPSTTLCIDCKAALESERQRFPGRLYG